MASSYLRSAAIKLITIAGLDGWARDWRRARAFRRKSRAAVASWEAAGRPAPPPDCIKYDRIRQTARERMTPILVETGTFYGDALFDLRHDFYQIHSIELSPGLHAGAQHALRRFRHIHLHLGDSTTELPKIAGSLKQPALFWLDGHYCAGPSARGDQDTPIIQELSFLFGLPEGRNVIMIDDARLFDGTNGYPQVEQLKAMALARRPKAGFGVANDIITIGPV